jgi:hypothetical protein
MKRLKELFGEKIENKIKIIMYIGNYPDKWTPVGKLTDLFGGDIFTLNDELRDLNFNGILQSTITTTDEYEFIKPKVDHYSLSNEGIIIYKNLKETFLPEI